MFLVAIYKKHTREILFYEEVKAKDQFYAVHLAFERHKELDGNNAWGEAVEIAMESWDD